jgi:CBS domain-containing protein
MKVEKLMTRNVKTCRREDRLNAAAQLMWENDCGCVPVIGTNGDGAVVGMLTDRDVCIAAYTQGKPLWQIAVATAMAQRVIACAPSDELERAEALMREHQVRRLPVINEKGVLEGIISLNDIAREAERERRAQRPQVSHAEIGNTLGAICQPHRRRAQPAAAA